MSPQIKLGFILSLGLVASGCYVTAEPGPAPTPTVVTTGGGPQPQPAPAPGPTDAPVTLGLQAMPGYHVLANGSAALPAGDLGYVITANGQGGYRVVWTDNAGTPARFQGVVTTDGQFDPSQVRGYSGAESITLSSDYRQITFDSTPGSALDGVDLVSSTDPIYVDLFVDGARSGFGIYFTGAQSGALQSSTYDPVAFTAP